MARRRPAGRGAAGGSWLTLGVLVAVAALLLSTCTGQDGDAEGQATGEITFISIPDFSFGAQREAAVRCWNALYPEQQVDYRELPPQADDQRAELMAKLQAEYEGYDLVALDVTWTQEFAKAELIRPLAEVAAEVLGEDADDRAIDLGRFFDAVLDTVEYDGRAWAVPLHTNVGMLYFNTEYVAADSVPTTWGGLAAYLREHPPPEGVAGYLGQLDDYEGLHVNASEIVWAHGGAFVDADGEVTADSPETATGLAFLTQGLREGWIPRAALEYDEQASLDAFRDGGAVFLRHWPYANAQLKIEESAVRDQFGVTQLPGVGDWPGPNALGGANLAVSAHGQHPQTAYEFMRFLTSEPVQRRMAEGGGYPTAIRSVYEGGPRADATLDQLIEDRCADWADQPEQPPIADRQPPRETLRGALEHTGPRPVTPYYDRVTTLIQRHVETVLNATRDATPADLKPLAEELDGALQGH